MKNNIRSKLKRIGRKILWGSLIALAGLTVLAIVLPDPPDSNKPGQNNGPERDIIKNVIRNDEPTPAKIASIMPSLERFRSQFNAYADEVNLQAKLPAIKMNKDNPSSFNTSVGEYLFIMGDVNNDGSVYDIVLFTANDGSTQSVANQILAIGGAITAQNPSFVAADRGRIVKKLGLFDDNLDLTTLNGKYTESGVEYKLYTIDGALVFSVAPENGELTK